MNNINDFITEIQNVLKDNDIINAMLLHDKILDTIFMNNSIVRMKLSKYQYLMGINNEGLDYINDLKILLIELSEMKNKVHFNDVKENKKLLFSVKK